MTHFGGPDSAIPWPQRQFWKRFSPGGFTGGGVAWNHFERLEKSLTVMTRGTGFRYELTRK